MNKYLILAVALLLSTAGFSQTGSVKAQSSGSADVNVQTSAVKETVQKAKDVTAKTTAAAKKEVNGDHSATVSTGTDAGLKAASKDNKLGQDASLKSETTVSTAKTEKSAAGVKEKTKTAAKATVKAVKPKPVSIKTHAVVKTTGGLKIK